SRPASWTGPSVPSRTGRASTTGPPADTDPWAHSPQPSRPEGRLPTETLIAGAAAIAVLSGSIGAVTASVLSEDGDWSRPRANVTTILGADPTTVSDRPHDSIAGVAATVLDSVVSV